jgi:hypothetical protein
LPAKEKTTYFSKEEYTEHYQKGLLYNTKFHEENILKPPVNIELRDNPNLHIIKRIEKEFKIQL